MTARFRGGAWRFRVQARSFRCAFGPVSVRFRPGFGVCKTAQFPYEKASFLAAFLEKARNRVYREKKTEIVAACAIVVASTSAGASHGR